MSLYDQYLQSRDDEDEEKKRDLYSEYQQWRSNEKPSDVAAEKVQPQAQEQVKKPFTERVVDFFKETFNKKEPPKENEVVAEVRGEKITASDAYLNTVESNKRLKPEIESTQNSLVEEWLKVVREHPQVLAEDRPYSGAAQFISKKEWDATQQTVKDKSDDELKEIIRQRLEANGWEELSVSDSGRGLKTKEIKDLTKRYVNQKETEAMFKEVIVDGTNDGDFREALKEGLGNPIKTAKDIQSKWDLFWALRRNSQGLELSPTDKAVLERAGAENVEQILDPKSFGYNLGRMLADMPEYVLMYGATKPIAEKVGAGVLGTKAMTALATKAPFIAKTIAFLTGTAAQTSTGFLPSVFEKTLDYSTKSDNFAYSKEGDIIIENLDANKPLTDIAFKNLPKAYAFTWVEVASESAGEGITYLKKGLLSRFFAKHADETVEGTISLAKSLGWNGIIEEIAEEEIAYLGQAPIEGEKVQLPFATKEGTERLLLETIGIGIMGTVMQTPTNAYNKAQYNKAVNQIKTQGKEMGMSDQEIELAIENIQEASQGMEEAVPPTAGMVEEEPESMQVAETTEFVPESSKGITIDTVSEETVYRGEDGAVTKSSVSYNNALKVDGYQEQLIQSMAEQGNTKAQEILNNKTDFFMKADALIKETFSGKYDVIEYTNKNTGIPSREKVGTEYFDLSSGAFYTANEDTANVYAKQRGRKTKFQNIKSDIEKRVETRTVKFREQPVTRENYRELAKESSTKLPIEYIFTDTDDFQDAAGDVASGDMPSFSELPVLVKLGKDGKYDIVDGNHRVVAALNRGDTSINVTTDEELYRKLAAEEEKELTSKAKRYIKGKDGKLMGSKSIRDSIKEYIDNRGVKLRTNEDELILSKNGRTMTTKFLEHPDIKGKDILSRSFIENLSVSKGVSLKAYEFSVIQDVLNKQFANKDKINMAEFRKAVLSQMMPLDVIPSDTYADYGAENIGMMNSSDFNYKTYILNSPFDHGRTGHFSQDFENSYTNEIEIKEIPVSEQNKTPKFAVIQKGVELTRENIAENVYTIANSRADAEEWIEKHTLGKGGENPILQKTKGLFAHFRAFDNESESVSYIGEVQSDAFQHGVGVTTANKALEADLKEAEDAVKEGEDMLKKDKEAGNNNAERKAMWKKKISDAKEAVERNKKRLSQQPEITEEEKVFQTYKNIWQERTVREAINIKAKEGFKTIRFPTPRTVAVIEGFTGGEYGENTMPYEIVSGDETKLVAGDIIDYGGEEYTVMEANDYSITVGLSDNVQTFDVDAFMDDELNNKWSEIDYSLRNIQESFGKIETVRDVKNVLKANDILQRLHQYSKIEKDVAGVQERWDRGDGRDLQDRIDRNQKEVDMYSKFINLLKDDVVIKENITKENIQDINFKDDLEKKYGIPHSYWNYILDAYRIYDESIEVGIGVVSKNTLIDVEPLLEKYTQYLQDSKNKLEGAKLEKDKEIQEIKDRKKPTETELKTVPKEMADKAKDPESYYFGFNIDDNLLEILEANAERDSNETFSLDDINDDWFENERDNFNVTDSIDGIYSDYYIDDRTVYASIDGNTESFNQPDGYEGTSSIEDFDIEKFDGEQRTVLDFYAKQLNPYLEKLRRGNLETVQDENGYEWLETQITEKDLEPPTAYRIKDDLEQVGITIDDKQEKEILRLNKKFFGDSSVKITEQILANNKALGSYSANLIKILSGQVNPKDTFYHEAVHKYIDVFLTKDEQVDLFMAAVRKYKTSDLNEVEERLAEDFISYAKSREGVTGKIKAVFDRLISRIQSYLGNKDAINDLYSEIITPAKTKKTAEQKVKKITKTAQKKAEVKEVVIPKPIGRGEKKVSSLGVGVETKAVEAELVKQFADLPEYNQVSVDSQINRATKMVTEDFDRAVRIALGQEQPPYGLLPESVFVAVENKALEDGSVSLLRQLATSVRVGEATAMGQRIRLLAERNPDSAVNSIREITQARKEAIEKSKGYTVEKEAAKIKKEVDNKVKEINKYDWKSFIDSIEC